MPTRVRVFPGAEMSGTRVREITNSYRIMHVILLLLFFIYKVWSK